jgi:hypothetical protein
MESRCRRKRGKIHLKAGVYPIEVVWFNGGGGWLDVFYQSSTMQTDSSNNSLTTSTAFKYL